MASSLHLITAALLLFSITNALFTNGLDEDELGSMLNVLRDSGYNLFGNAIITSDLFYEVLSGKTFTFFAPTDSSLFALDMTSSAVEYTAYLRCHVIPVRISVSELRRLPSGSSLTTLLENNRVNVIFQRRNSMTDSDEVISVGGVRVTFPGLFYSRNLAVHGLAGTINCNRTSPPPMQPPEEPIKPPPENLDRNHRRFPPPVNKNLTGAPGRHSPGANSSGEHNIHSPVTQSQSQPMNSSSNHNFESPTFNQSYSPAISPTPEESYDHHVKSEEAETPDFSGYPEAPVNLFSPDFSPSYDLWPRIPKSRSFDSSIGPPPSAEFSENDDPVAFPPSDVEYTENHGSDTVSMESESTSMSGNGLLNLHEEERKNSFADYVPVISREDEAMMETAAVKRGPSDEVTRDCPRTLEFPQSSFLPSTTNMFCTGE